MGSICCVVFFHSAPFLDSMPPFLPSSLEEMGVEFFVLFCFVVAFFIVLEFLCFLCVSKLELSPDSFCLFLAIGFQRPGNTCLCLIRGKWFYVRDQPKFPFSPLSSLTSRRTVLDEKRSASPSVSFNSCNLCSASSAPHVVGRIFLWVVRLLQPSAQLFAPSASLAREKQGR